MKTITNIAILCVLLVMTIAGSGAVSFFSAVGLLFFLLGMAMDFYAVEKKNDQLPDVRNVFNEAQKELAQHPADTNPAQASNGYQMDGIQNGKGFHRNEEQAEFGDYDSPNAPADTVTVFDVAPAAKPTKDIQLEI